MLFLLYHRRSLKCTFLYLQSFIHTLVITYNADEQNAEIYTANKNVMRKIDSLCKLYPDIYKLKKQGSVSKTYSVPKSYISYRRPRNISAEDREKARQRMIALNKHDK